MDETALAVMLSLVTNVFRYFYDDFFAEFTFEALDCGHDPERRISCIVP